MPRSLSRMRSSHIRTSYRFWTIWPQLALIQMCQISWPSIRRRTQISTRKSTPEPSKSQLKNSDKPAFSFDALGSSLPSVLFQSAPPLDLAFNSRIPGVHRNKNPIDVNPGTVAQNSVSSCASDSTQAIKEDKPIQCDIIDPNSCIWLPQANDNSGRHTRRRETRW